MSEHQHEKKSNNLTAAIALNILIVVTEIVFGVIARSTALISEALHNFTDIGSMALSLWGEKVADRPKTNQKTFGYKRVEIIIAFVNGGILLGVSGWVLVESVLRIFHPEQVAGMTMLVVATISLLGNGIATYLLEKDAHKNLNLKSAWLHSLQDALFSLAVVVGAIIITYTHWNWIDPVASIVISVFLLKEVYAMLKTSVNMLLDAVPVDVDFVEVKNTLMDFDGVENINDLHIWQTGTDDRFLSAHVIIGEMSSASRLTLMANIIEALRQKYHIEHSTLQMVSALELKQIGLACAHCN